MAEADTEGTWMQLMGFLPISCPECGQVFPVAVYAGVESAEDGSQHIAYDSDTADLWSHAWGHEQEGT